MSKQKELKTILLIVLAAFILRVLNISFPAFTPDEARIAYRGFTLVNYRVDELGRFLPLVFNSLSDYQLPVASYFTSLGILIFGKSDFGARIPFIILGSLLPLLVYQLGKVISDRKSVWYWSAILTAFSPPLIFLSKTPNEIIILIFLITLLFYLLTRNSLNVIFIFLIFLLSCLTSKYAWFILPLFTGFTLYFYHPNNLKKNFSIFALSVVVVLVAWAAFFSLPQGFRSFSENNFSLFSNITIQNGVNRLRGQGIEMGWPSFLSKILFNKLIFLPIGVLHWFSNISPAIYFGKLDTLGIFNYSSIGSLVKSLIIPLVLALMFLIKEGSRKQKLFLMFVLIFTFPAIFKYPRYSPELVAITIPFLVVVVSLGLFRLRGMFYWLVVCLMFIEVVTNVIFLTPEIKAANTSRPQWIKPVAQEIYELSKIERIIISDNITEDMIPYLLWHGDFKIENKLTGDNFPYRFHRSSLENIILYGWDQKFQLCGREKMGILFLSKRDLNLVKHRISPEMIKVSKNSLGEENVFSFPNHLCQEK